MRYNYVKYDEQATKQQEAFKASFEGITGMVDSLKDGRAKALVLTKLEEAYMWVGKSIRDDQVARGSQPEHVAERSNE